MPLEENPYDNPLNLRQQAVDPNNIFVKMIHDLEHPKLEAPDTVGASVPADAPSPSETALPSREGGHKAEKASVAASSIQSSGPPSFSSIDLTVGTVALHPEGTFTLRDEETKSIVDICLGAFVRSTLERARAMARAHGFTVQEPPPVAAPPAPKRRGPKKKA